MDKKFFSFRAQIGRDPIAGQDYDPIGGLCQDEYEYLTGTGRYSHHTELIEALAAEISAQWNGAKVTAVTIDPGAEGDTFLSVSATIDGDPGVDCGQVEDLYRSAFERYYRAFDEKDPKTPVLMSIAAKIKPYIK